MKAIFDYFSAQADIIGITCISAVHETGEHGVMEIRDKDSYASIVVQDGGIYPIVVSGYEGSAVWDFVRILLE